MTTPTTKQIAFAQKLFAKTHLPQFATFEDEMRWLDWNPENGRDVSAYIDLMVTAKADARKTLRRY